MFIYSFIQSAPRVITYPREIEEIMTAVKLGKVQTLSPELEGTCREIAALSAAWARNVRFALLSFEEWYQRESWLESWAVLAQNAALNSRTLALVTQSARSLGFLDKYASGCTPQDAYFLRRQGCQKNLRTQHIYKEDQESKVQFRHCFEDPTDCVNVTIPRSAAPRISSHCRELRMHGDGLERRPRLLVLASV
jgi:hypothetical protein